MQIYQHLNLVSIMIHHKQYPPLVIHTFMAGCLCHRVLEKFDLILVLYKLQIDQEKYGFSVIVVV